MNQVDILIVGQGIAGTIFAHELEKRQQSFMVVDDGHHNASLTAAGMVNPVVLKRFSPVWQGKEQIMQARCVLGELRDKINQDVDYRFDLMRVFNNENERTTWITKSKTPLLQEFLQTPVVEQISSALIAPHGLGNVLLGGRADLHALLSGYRKYLQDRGCLREEAFCYHELAIQSDSVCYKDIKAKYIVFCEGYGMKANPYFNDLPLNGNKGEVLVVRIPHLHLSQTIKSSVFIMPLPEQGNDVYFIGSTYNWTEKDAIPTYAAKDKLLSMLEQLLTPEVYASVEVLEHRAGMRPTVSDRRPLLGRHPEHKSLFVFNGLGTRGVMLGATMAPLLADHIIHAQPLPAAVDITRFCM